MMKTKHLFHFRLMLGIGLALVPSAMRLQAGLIATIAQEDQYVVHGPNSIWDPTPVQTKDALEKIEAYLQTSKDKDAHNILFNVHRYKVQFWGVMENNKQVIYCNFFCNFPEPLPGYFRKSEVHALDGGYFYWHAEYDPQSGQVLTFSEG
jgi:hypothetical protein